MNPFEPASLSPRPKPSQECPLPYGLTWEDLQACLPDYSPRPAVACQALEKYEKQGLNGGPNSCILTLRYPGAEGQPHSVTVFLKQTDDPRKMEAEKYRYLASMGVPTPSLLAAIYKGGFETVVLEFLAVIGIDFQSPQEAVDLLRLAAQINAIQAPPDLFPSPPSLPQVEFDEGVRQVLGEMATQRSLPFAVDVPRWFAAYIYVKEACRVLPTALNHNQFFFQQVGWALRGQTRQLVIFDLETMSVAPRFYDIATVLKPLARYTGRDQAALFKIYYDRLNELSRLDLGMDEAFHELSMVKALDTFYSLPWFYAERESAISGTIIPTPEGAMIDLYEDLKWLKFL